MGIWGCHGPVVFKENSVGEKKTRGMGNNLTDPRPTDCNRSVSTKSGVGGGQKEPRIVGGNIGREKGPTKDLTYGAADKDQCGGSRECRGGGVGGR